MATYEQLQDLPMDQARFILDKYRKLEAQMQDYRARIDQMASGVLGTESEKIDEQYADQLEEAEDDPEELQRIQNEIAQLKSATRSNLEKQAAVRLDGKLREEGKPTLSQVSQEMAVEAPYVQLATEKVAAFERAGASDPRGAGGLGLREFLEKSQAERRIADAQREQNVISAMMKAEQGGEEEMNKFLSDVESISDPIRQDDTINLMLRMGFESPRHIYLRGGGSIKMGRSGGTDTLGGGYFRNRDGSVSVQMPDGTTTKVDRSFGTVQEREAEAERLLREFGPTANETTPNGTPYDNTPITSDQDAINLKRQNRINELNNQVATESQRISQFMREPAEPMTFNADGNADGKVDYSKLFDESPEVRSVTYTGDGGRNLFNPRTWIGPPEAVREKWRAEGKPKQIEDLIDWTAQQGDKIARLPEDQQGAANLELSKRIREIPVAPDVREQVLSSRFGNKKEEVDLPLSSSRGSMATFGGMF